MKRLLHETVWRDAVQHVYYSEVPGHLGVLPHTQQDGLRVDEQPPAGQAEQQQDDDAPLKDHAHLQQIPAPKRLSNITHILNSRPQTSPGEIGTGQNGFQTWDMSVSHASPRP